MVLVDTNVIIRILVGDNIKMMEEALDFVEANKVLARNEVIAEVVYVLQGVYKLDKTRIHQLFIDLLEDGIIHTENKSVVTLALDTFATKNLDFVDCLLYAHNQLNATKVFTFDKTLNKLIRTNL